MGRAAAFWVLVSLTACHAEPLSLGDTVHGADLAGVTVANVDLGSRDLTVPSPDLAAVLTAVHLDQAHVGVAGEWGSTTEHIVQTFTVGVDGTLVGIECLFAWNGGGGPIVMDVSNGATLTRLGTAQIDSSAALPQSALSAGTTLPLETIGSGYFSLPDGIPVTAGQQLRIGFTGADVMVASGYAPFEGGTDYPDGQEYADVDTLGRDLLFKTFVAY